MKKLRKLSLLLVLELGCMGAAMPGIVETEVVDITVNHFVLKTTGAENVGTVKVSKPSYSKQEIDIVEREGTHFTAAFIANGTSQVYEAGASVENDITVNVTKGGVTVNLYYTAIGSSSIAFIDQSDRLVVSKTYANGASLSEEVITEAKNKYEANLPSGYEYGNITDETGNPVSAGLKIDTDKLFTVNSKKKDNYASFDVLVQKDSGVESSRVAFDEIATVTSTDKNFSYWAIGEKIVSYEKEYSFSVYSDTVIKEVCGEVVEKKPIVTLQRDNIADTGMANIYEVKYEIPAGFELVETGMIFGGTTLETATSKVVARRITSNNEYSVRSAADGNHRAYLIYRKDGKLNVIYDDGYGVEQLVFGNPYEADQTAALTLDGINKHIISSHSTITANVNSVVVGEENKLCVYNGKYSSLKIGASKNNGAVGFTSDTGTFDKAVVNAYSGDGSTLSAEGSDSSFVMTSDAAVHTYNFDTPVKDFKVTTNEKRANINYIELFYSNREKSEEINLSGLTLGDLSKVISDITLPTEYEGNAVTWTSSDPSVISETGVVTLPDTDVAKVTLTATVKGKSKSFDAVVYSYDAYLGEVLTQITVPETVEDGVTNISLPATVDGVRIYWGTSDPSTITYKGVVTHFELDNTVTLTATAYIGDTYGSAIAKKSKEFTVVVAAKKAFVGFEFTYKDVTGLPTAKGDAVSSTVAKVGDIEYNAPFCYKNTSSYFMMYRNKTNNTYFENKNAFESNILSVTVKMNTGSASATACIVTAEDPSKLVSEGGESYTLVKNTMQLYKYSVPAGSNHKAFRLYVTGTTNVQVESIQVEYEA